MGLAALPLRTLKRLNSGGLEREPRFAPVQAHNIIPTVKPIKLTTWLATLLLPPATIGVRRLLNPFSGSGSEIIGAQLAGFEATTGLEALPLHHEIGVARTSAWQTYIADFGRSAIYHALFTGSLSKLFTQPLSLQENLFDD